MPSHCHACVDMSAGQQALYFSESFLFAKVGQLHRAKRLHKTYKQLRMHMKYITVNALEDHAVKSVAACIVVCFTCMHRHLHVFKVQSSFQLMTRSHNAFHVITASTLNLP